LHVNRFAMGDFQGRGGSAFAHLTRFWVHSRSRLVSRAVFRPSLKLDRTPFSRRCARAWSSSSSCCFAFSWPELVSSYFVSLIIAHLFWFFFCVFEPCGSRGKSVEIDDLIFCAFALGSLTFVPVLRGLCPMVLDQMHPACGRSGHRRHRRPSTMQS
jgi:hypothetical protein